MALPTPGKPSRFSLLVWGGVDTLSQELLDVANAVIPADELDDLPIDKSIKCQSLNRTLGLHYFLNFEWRIRSRLKTFPFKLLVLAKERPGAPRRERQSICAEILDTPEHRLHLSAPKVKVRLDIQISNVATTHPETLLPGMGKGVSRKWREGGGEWEQASERFGASKVIFLSELERCRCDGTLGMVLWAPLRLVAKVFSCSNQAMESLAKLAKNGCKKAPSIGLPLLDARVGLKRELGL
eukprot:8810053-Pyramimonas_sp.AAC.2